MAKTSVSGFEPAERVFQKLGRNGIRRIVEAGSTAAQVQMQGLTRTAGHVKTGDLMGSIQPRGPVYESLGGAMQIVDFVGDHGHGITNHDLAFVIDNGRPADRFINKNERTIEKAAAAAMQAESDRLMAEVGAAE